MQGTTLNRPSSIIDIVREESEIIMSTSTRHERLSSEEKTNILSKVNMHCRLLTSLLPSVFQQVLFETRENKPQ